MELGVSRPALVLFGRMVPRSSKLVRSLTHSLTHSFPRVQGDLDPWMAGGVTRNITSSLTAYIIAGGAHHLDLMWSNPLDPQSVLDVRNAERAAISSWIQQVNQQNEAMRQLLDAQQEL